MTCNAPISPEADLAKYGGFIAQFEATEILVYPEIFFLGFLSAKLQMGCTIFQRIITGRIQRSHHPSR
jgi:hypothetical protein